MASFSKLSVGSQTYRYAPIGDIAGIETLPYSLRVLLENAVRQAARGLPAGDDIGAILRRETGAGLTFYPARVFLQDLLGIPLLVDLAALRDAVAAAGGDPQTVNPKVPADLVIDHSLRVDVSATPASRAINLELEYARNEERFSFVRWCQTTFDKLRVVPPGKGIMHQINIEYLGKVVWSEATPDGILVYPDTVVGTDSHTPMINGLGIVGWGVGGIEAEAVMLGKPASVPLPEVVGVEVKGKMPEGTTPTDLVLTITEMLRKMGVVGKFVEFFGPALDLMPVGDRGTIANMAPEYGATCVYFPIDARTVDYLKLTGREDEQIALIEAYARAQKLWRDASTPIPQFDTVVSLDLSTIRPCIAGPWNPEDRIDLEDASEAFKQHYQVLAKQKLKARTAKVEGEAFTLSDGAVVIAAITSCTNTSNPINMAAAGLIAQKAVAKGLTVKPWVKTSLAPGSQVVAAILENAGLQKPLDALGFNVVGFGCTTCNGMSGPLRAPIAEAIEREKLVAAAVLSGNRNFEGRIHPNVRAAYLASPALVVAYAIAGNLLVDVTREALGHDCKGKPVYLKDIWPGPDEIRSVVESAYDPKLFREKYADVFDGDKTWEALTGSSTGNRFDWQSESTYVRRPPFFDGLPANANPPSGLIGMRPLAILGDSITTDHISPSGAISLGTPAADFLIDLGVPQSDFNSYGTRRGNFNVVMRSVFANIRTRNKMVPGTEGGITKLEPDGTVMPIFDAAIEYGKRGVPLVIVAGRNYGCGSSRDAAAKGVALLGVKAVIAESFERIHRTNLIGMGVLPLALADGITADALGLDGTETFDLPHLDTELGVRSAVTCVIRRTGGRSDRVMLRTAIETEEEAVYWRNGGILPFVWRDHLQEERLAS